MIILSTIVLSLSIVILIKFTILNENYLIKQLEKSDASFPDIYFSIDELDKLELTLDELRTLEPFIKI